MFSRDRTFISDDELVQTRIQENLEFSLDNYAEMLGSAPTYATYYNRVVEESTQDKGLDAVYAVVATDSPVRYRRVETFPIYNLQQIVLALSEGAYGLEADITSECVVLPHTIKPYADDLVAVLVPGGYGYVVFQVTSVEPSVTGSKRFFKLGIQRVEKTLEQCEVQTTEESIFSVQDFEGGRRAVILKSDAEVLARAREHRQRLVAKYSRLFYDGRIAAFACKHAGLNLVHFGVHELLESGRALEFDRPFYDVHAVMASPPTDLYNILLERFESSIYGCIRDHTLAEGLYSDSFITLIINWKGTPFLAYKDRFYECWDNSLCGTPGGSVYYSEPGFADRIRNNALYTTSGGSGSGSGDGDEDGVDASGYELENFIIRYVNESFESNSTLVDDASKIRVRPSLRYFLLCPCVIFALRRMEDLLTAIVQER